MNAKYAKTRNPVGVTDKKRGRYAAQRGNAPARCGVPLPAVRAVSGSVGGVRVLGRRRRRRGGRGQQGIWIGYDIDLGLSVTHRSDKGSRPRPGTRRNKASIYLGISQVYSHVRRPARARAQGDRLYYCVCVHLPTRAAARPKPRPSSATSRPRKTAAKSATFRPRSSRNQRRRRMP